MQRDRSRSPKREKEHIATCLGKDENCTCGEDMSGIIPRDEGSTLNFEALSVHVDSNNQAQWVEKAAKIWKQYRVLIMRDVFSADVTDEVLKSLKDVHTNWSAKYDPERKGNRMSGRYELMDAFDSWHLTHLPGYLEALEEFAQKGGLKFLEAIGDYKFVGGHAHLCLSGTDNWQPLHSDFVHPDGWATRPLWDAPEHVAFMDMIFTLHPLTSDNAALRVVPGHPSVEKTYKQFVDGGYPPPRFMHESDIFKRARLFPLPKGCAILRDLRIWHGGTPNTSDGDRYTAVLRFYSSWSCDMWKDRHYEGRGVDPQDIKNKLSEDTQKIVCQHIIRREGDPAPKLTTTAGWDSSYDGWAHAFDEKASRKHARAYLMN